VGAHATILKLAALRLCQPPEGLVPPSPDGRRYHPVISAAAQAVRRMRWSTHFTRADLYTLIRSYTSSHPHLPKSQPRRLASARAQISIPACLAVAVATCIWDAQFRSRASRLALECYTDAALTGELRYSKRASGYIYLCFMSTGCIVTSLLTK